MYYFNPVETRDNLVAAIHRTVNALGSNKVVVGISGGKDSTVTAALCVRALGKENVYGVMLPDKVQLDLSDSLRVCRALEIPHTKINIGPAHIEMLRAIDLANDREENNHFGVLFSPESDINIGPRLRMTVLRYITQALGARLAGTGNLSEITVGYCTKDGDTSCDFSVLGGLTSIEVVQVGLTMPEIPRDLVIKTPTDGLSGLSDEEKLGISYEDIHHYIRKDQEIPEEVANKIATMEKKNFHKRFPPLVIYDVERPNFL